MKCKGLLSLFIFILFTSNVQGGQFYGELILYPKDCQKTDSRICKLGAELTYKSTRKNLVCQSGLA